MGSAHRSAQSKFQWINRQQHRFVVGFFSKERSGVICHLSQQSGFSICVFRKTKRVGVFPDRSRTKSKHLKHAQTRSLRVFSKGACLICVCHLFCFVFL